MQDRLKYVVTDNLCVLGRKNRMRRTTLAAIMSFFMTGAVWAAPVVVFTGEVAANPDLYQIDLASMDVMRLTTASSAEKHSTVTADGKTIAFVSDADGASSLYLMNTGQASAAWHKLGIGNGAYAHPAFSPDGSRIVVSYAPDPEAPLLDTRLALVDVKARTQTVILEGKNVWPDITGSEGSLLVLDRPQWADATNILFVALEYADAETGRLISATLYRLNLTDKKLTRLTGGESYFDEKGTPRGFKASVPWCRSDGGLVTFAALQGHIDRTPMSMALDAKNKRVLPISDQQFWGPAIPVGGEYLYGFRDDDDGQLKLALTTKSGRGPRRVLPFAGTALDPVLIP